MCKIMNLLDILVLPSLEEPFGNVLLEAGICGKVVVASNVGGIPEMVQNGQTGYLIAKEDIDELVDSILRLIDNPLLRKKMGEFARENVLKKFNMQDKIHQMQEIYLTLNDEGEGRYAKGINSN